MRRALGGVLVFLVAVGLAACGGDDGGGEIEVLAQVELEGIPSDVEAADDAVWIADTDDSVGGLRKLDPESLEETALLPVSGGAEAVAIGDSTVWALSRTLGDVIAFDPEATEGEGRTIDIGGGSSDPVSGEAFEDLAASGDVAYANGSLGLRRVTENGEVAEPPDEETADSLEGSELEFSETPVVATADAVWAMTDDGVRDFDPETLEPIDDLGSTAEALAVGGDEVWAVQDDGLITRVISDDDDEEIANLEEAFPDEEDPEAIAYAGDVLWVVAAGELRRLDPDSGDEIGEPLTLPDGTDESGYAISAAPDDSVVILQRPTGLVWRVG